MIQNNHFINERKINLDFKLSTENEAKIENWKKEKIFFGVFPIKGDSMTFEDVSKSIPDGSKVLVYDTQIDCNNVLANIWHQLPKDEPLLIKGKTDSGKDFFVCKTISSIDAVNDNILLSSYNSTHQSTWIPFGWIANIFKIVQLI